MCLHHSAKQVFFCRKYFTVRYVFIGMHVNYRCLSKTTETVFFVFFFYSCVEKVEPRFEQDILLLDNILTKNAIVIICQYLIKL